jgi:ribose-phosphate pyrophosphokinase
MKEVNSIEEIINKIVVVPIIYESEFAQKFIEHLGKNVNSEDYFDPQVFSGGEFCPRFKTDNKTTDGPILKEKSVYIIAPPSTRLAPEAWAFRIMLTADAAKRAGAENVVLAAMDLPYSRQDRGPKEDPKFKGQPFSAQVLANGLKTSGIDKIITMHKHSNRIAKIYEEVYGMPYEKIFFELDAAPIIAHYLTKDSSLVIANRGENVVFVGPDKGSLEFLKRVREYMDIENSSFISCKKTRGKPNDPSAVHISVDFKSDNYAGLEGKSLILLDDLGDTCGTIVQAYYDLMNNNDQGKPKEMYIYFTHPVMAGNNFYQAQKRLERLKAKEIIVTNSHPFIEDRRTVAFKQNSSVLRCAAYFASAAVNCVEAGRSPEDIFSVECPSDLEKFNSLYEIKRSTLHFLNSGKSIVRVNQL